MTNQVKKKITRKVKVVEKRTVYYKTLAVPLAVLDCTWEIHAHHKLMRGSTSMMQEQTSDAVRKKKGVG